MVRSARERSDACPGALSTYHAADGPLARIRIPGGRLTTDQLTTLAQAAAEIGDGRLHLTSRANVQLRALSDPGGVASRLDAAGLLPSRTHERVRNVLASPLSGVTGGFADVTPLISALDRAICVEPRLARLGGRFQFGLDDGRGDLPDTALDVGWRALAPADVRAEPMGTLVLGGIDTGQRVPLSETVAAMVSAALAFLSHRAAEGSKAWHVRELATPMIADTPSPQRPSDARDHCADVGAIPHDTGGLTAVVAGATFGTLSAHQAEVIADLAPAGVVVTPWRSLVLPGFASADVGPALHALAAAGLIIDPGDPTLLVTACIGSPGCASSAADVRADAHRLLADLPAGMPVHLSGCERRCGRPQTGHIDVVATGGGYTVEHRKDRND